tara:strand:+ start:295 stop:561 length:267 start_codon:yes stop_codon:yes gene_type:complete
MSWQDVLKSVSKEKIREIREVLRGYIMPYNDEEAEEMGKKLKQFMEEMPKGRGLLRPVRVSRSHRDEKVRTDTWKKINRYLDALEESQ